MIQKLDAFGIISLLSCLFALCTTRPIGHDQRPVATFEATPDKVDRLMIRLDAFEKNEGSLSSALKIQIAQAQIARIRKTPELRPLQTTPDTMQIIRISPHFGERNKKK